MKLSKIVQALNCVLPEGVDEREIKRISSFKNADSDCITFLAKSKFRKEAQECLACAILIKKEDVVDGKINIIVNDPYLAYALVSQLFEDRTPVFGEGIADSAIVDSTSNIAQNVSVAPGTVIGKNCSIAMNTEIGANCIIENNVSIGSDCRIDSGSVIRSGTMIGNKVIIQAGTVIGSEGFGNAMSGSKFIRIPCFGNVVIEDDVEIGANVTIDRGNFEPTLIKRGARIDNLVMIAHNVEIGENTAMAAQVGISGSTKIGKNVMMGGQAGLAGHISVGDYAFIGAKSGIVKSLEPNQKVTGCPAQNIMKMRRVEAIQMTLPEMKKELARLTKLVEKLSSDLSER